MSYIFLYPWATDRLPPKIHCTILKISGHWNQKHYSNSLKEKLSRNHFHVYWAENNKSGVVPYQQAHMCTTYLHDEIKLALLMTVQAYKMRWIMYSGFGLKAKRFEEKKRNWETICRQVKELQDTRQEQDSSFMYVWNSQQIKNINVLHNLRTAYRDSTKELHVKRNLT